MDAGAFTGKTWNNAKRAADEFWKSSKGLTAVI